MMKKGFTIIELLIFIILFSVLSLSVLWFFIAGLKAWSTGKERSQVVQSASLALERMVREIGQANGILTAKPNQIIFTADIDGNGASETITFDVNNKDVLERTEGVPPSDTAVALAPDVSAFTLGYYLTADSGNLLSQAVGPTVDDIRVVVISVTLERADEIFTLSSSAYARNMGT